MRTRTRLDNLGRRRQGVAGSVAVPFSPEDLGGFVESPFDVAALREDGNLWQDTLKTVAAVADNDPVRVADCGTLDYVAPSDAARPLLKDLGGGKWSLDPDGTNDVLVTAAATVATGSWVVGTAVASAGALLVVGGVLDFSAIANFGTGDVFAIDATNAAPSVALAVASGDTLIVWRAAGGSIFARVNDDAAVTILVGEPPFGAYTLDSLFARPLHNFGAAATAGTVIAVGTEPSEAELDQLAAYLAALLP